MRIHIDIGHPAHVHYFRNMIKILERQGYEFLVTARNRQYVFELLDAYGIQYVDRGKGSDNALGKIVYLIKTSLKIYSLALKFKPELFIDFGTMYSCLSGFLMRKKHIVFEDTENADLYRLLYKPFVNVIYTPECFERDLGKKHKRFRSYMELSYLHKNYFQPDVSVLSEAGLKKGDVFSIVRFVNWKAAHDFGKAGLSVETKVAVVKALEKYGRVFISSEIELPEELTAYQLPVKPEKLHSLMHYASLVLGESATMASEAAVLGTPSVFIDETGRGYTNDIERRYGILFNFKPDNEDPGPVIQKAEELLSNPDHKNKAMDVRERIHSEMIDLTKFMIDIVKQRTRF